MFHGHSGFYTLIQAECREPGVIVRSSENGVVADVSSGHVGHVPSCPMFGCQLETPVRWSRK